MSEMTDLLRKIELECEAAKHGMEGYPITARHDFIQARYENIGNYQKELAQYVSVEEANLIVVETYAKVVG